MKSDASNSKSESWDNYWQGRQAQTSGSALVGVEDNPEIMTFWRSVLAPIPREYKIMDLACGAGTVLKILDNLSFSDLSGVDVSVAAIEVLGRQLPEVDCTVSALENLPHKDESFQLLVSQFGFEYANREGAVSEVSRILKPSGDIIFLSHKKGSAIHHEVLSKLHQMTLFEKIEIFDISKELFTAALTGRASRPTQDIGADFLVKRKALEKIAMDYGGLAQHYLMGVRQMYERRDRYDLSDILGWIDGNENEMRKFIGRMQSMDEAALEESEIDNLSEAFKAVSIRLEKPDTLRDKKGRDLGWVIKAKKDL